MGNSIKFGKVDKTFNAGLKVETATVDRRDMQYSYKDGEGYVFMDFKTYEQTYVTAETVGEAADLMLEGQDVTAKPPTVAKKSKPTIS